MDHDKLNNMIHAKTATKICRVQCGNPEVTIYWDTIQDRLIVDDNLSVRGVPNDMENMDEIIRWMLNIPNESWLNFNLRATVMGTDVEINPDSYIQYDRLKNIGYLGDYIYGDVTILM